ncbi:MAG TPA: hypothetical protein VID48_14565 [Solirubrobacteraceae bacterium]|jgi:hypothetical protein
MSEEQPFEREQTDQAAREAAEIGGRADEQVDQAQRPVTEAGGGESEGFEQTQRELIEHASHADQQSAHAILHDRGRPEEPVDSSEQTAGDHEHSSELRSDEHGQQNER